MEDDAKNYIFKDCLISEALRSNTHSPGLPSNGLYYDVVGSSSNTNLSYFQGSLDLNLDYSSPPSRVHNYLVADQTSSTPKSRNLVDTNAFFDLNDYQPIFDSSPDIEIDGDSVEHRKLFIESTDVSTIATTTVEPNPQNRRIPSSDENRSRFPNRCREIFIHSRDDNKIFDTKPLISRNDEEEVVITDDGQYFAGEYILAN
uniref:Uncharacterized protein n=1 Tax=Romanomermis culicivorax TaxID=13658 RepID=A0A915I2F6_ROMCU